MGNGNKDKTFDFVVDARNGTPIFEKGKVIRSQNSGVQMKKARIPDEPLNLDDFTIDQLGGVKQPKEQALDQRYRKRYPYKVNVNYLTAAETKLMRALMSHLDNRVALGIKQRVADLIQIDDKVLEAYNINRNSALRAIAEKHIDFTVIDVQRGIAICCIELDDVYHFRKDNIEKDAFKDDIFKECGIPLFRIKTKIDELNPDRDFREIDEAILEYFAPACPTCGKPMLLKYDRFGQRFYACVDNKYCRRTIQID